MIAAIVYKSQTGSCERYAKELSRRLHIPCYPLGSAPTRADGELIYVGWMMAGSVVGYKKLARKAPVAAVCAVGMAPVTEAGEAEGRAKNQVPDSVGYFSLQGGLHLDKLPLLMKLVMKLVIRDIAAKLREKKEKEPLSAQEQATYQMAVRGEGEPAAWDVDRVVAWAEARYQ